MYCDAIKMFYQVQDFGLGGASSPWNVPTFGAKVILVLVGEIENPSFAEGNLRRNKRAAVKAPEDVRVILLPVNDFSRQSEFPVGDNSRERDWPIKPLKVMNVDNGRVFFT